MWLSSEVGGAWLLLSLSNTQTTEGALLMTQAEKQLSILSCVSKKEQKKIKKKVANVFLTKDRKMTGCLGYAKNFSFHTY